MFDSEKTYTIHVWNMPVCVVDNETEDFIRNEDGSIKLFEIPKYDFSKVRPKGAKLKTFGGRASGPEPLEELVLFTIQLFQKSKYNEIKNQLEYEIQKKRYSKDVHFYLYFLYNIFGKITERDDQYLILLFCVGFGKYDIADIKIGNTPLGEFTAVETNTIVDYQGDELEIYTKDVTEESTSILIEQSGNWYSRNTEPLTDRISIDLSWLTGLRFLEHDGKQVSAGVDISIRHRRVGTNTWTYEANELRVDALSGRAERVRERRGSDAFEQRKVFRGHIIHTLKVHQMYAQCTEPHHDNGRVG